MCTHTHTQVHSKCLSSMARSHTKIGHHSVENFTYIAGCSFPLPTKFPFTLPPPRVPSLQVSPTRFSPFLVYPSPSLTPSKCTPPIHPVPYLHGYVATLSTDGPLLCGGTPTGECYLLTTKNMWLGPPPLAPMLEERTHAAAAAFGGGWWVTG